MPTDAFSGFAESLISPAKGCFAITPADAGGNIVLTPPRGSRPVTFRNVLLDVRVSAIAATGTTAGDIVGLV